jgi:hypothetical protein
LAAIFVIRFRSGISLLGATSLLDKYGNSPALYRRIISTDFFGVGFFAIMRLRTDQADD